MRRIEREALVANFANLDAEADHLFINEDRDFGHRS